MFCTAANLLFFSSSSFCSHQPMMASSFPPTYQPCTWLGFHAIYPTELFFRMFIPVDFLYLIFFNFTKTLSFARIIP
uniref:Uncharacterized protein n=1 Tax=Panstrongylus lignarius TaxID=156445 RepID=A0A224Y3V6_9HEMI